MGMDHIKQRGDGMKPIANSSQSKHPGFLSDKPSQTSSFDHTSQNSHADSDRKPARSEIAISCWNCHNGKEGILSPAGGVFCVDCGANQGGARLL